VGSVVVIRPTTPSYGTPLCHEPQESGMDPGSSFSHLVMERSFPTKTQTEVTTHSGPVKGNTCQGCMSQWHRAPRRESVWLAFKNDETCVSKPRDSPWYPGPQRPRVYMCQTRGVEGLRGTWTPKDRDEVNTREVSECDGQMLLW
jgi:hypothetical protein